MHNHVQQQMERSVFFRLYTKEKNLMVAQNLPHPVVILHGVQQRYNLVVISNFTETKYI